MNIFLTASALMLVLSTRAFAGEPTEAEKRALAESIFEQASTALTSGDYAVACPKLEEVVKLQPNGTGARIKLAECYEATGKLASAHASYVQAASMASLSGQSSRAEAASAKANALEPRLSKLTIKVRSDLARLPGLSVMRAESPVTPSLFNVAIAVDGGKQTIAAAADGREPFTTTVDIDSSDAQKEVEIVLPLASNRSTGPADGVEAAPTGEASGMPPVRISGIVVGAIGLAMAGAGIGIAVTGLGQGDDALAAYDAATDQQQADAALADRDTASDMAVAGWAVMGVGAAATVAGVIMIAVAPARQSSPDKTAFSLRVAPSGAGLAVMGTW